MKKLLALFLGISAVVGFSSALIACDDEECEDTTTDCDVTPTAEAA